MKRLIMIANLMILCSSVHTQNIKQKNVNSHTQLPSNDFDEEAKRKQVIDLVERAVDYFNKHSFAQACNAFTFDKDFLPGELYIFLTDMKGRSFTSGDQADVLWVDLWGYTDEFGALVIQETIKKAESGGGWVRYRWRHSSKVSYVQKVEKNGIAYTIGAGYYPHTAQDAVVTLVKRAVALFNDVVAQGEPVSAAFARMNYPTGLFVIGDYYIYALRFDGLTMALGDTPGLVGTNTLDYQDIKGKFSNKDIINKLKDKRLGEGIWDEYYYRNAFKRAYAEKVMDKAGNKYFIACGYNPYVNQDTLIDLVNRGYTYMKGHGLSTAVEIFTSKHKDDYRYGGLYLFVYDMKGNCLAHGGNEDLVGQNLYDLKDASGQYYIRGMIELAKSGGGWINFFVRNSLASGYVKKIDLGLESYIIGSSFFSTTRNETMKVLTQSGVDFLRSNERSRTFREFMNTEGKFIKGELELFVIDTNGICYVYGDNYDLIWRDLRDIKDDEGKFFIQEIIKKIKYGPTVFKHKFNNAQRISYIELLKKNGKKYIIGSGYYK